jgi:hypothetical protein
MQSISLLSSSIATSSTSFTSYVDGLRTLFEQNIEQMSCSGQRRQGRVLADPDASQPHQMPSGDLCVAVTRSPCMISALASGPDVAVSTKPSPSQAKPRRSSSSSPTPSQASLASTQTVASASRPVRNPSPSTKPCAVSCKTKLAMLQDQSRRDGDIQRARLARTRLESQQQQQQQTVKKDGLLVSGAGRYARAPIVI